MPELRDVTIQVTTTEGEPLKEWGVQHFRRNNKCSCYVQSKTDMSFRVSLQPRIPYVAPDTASAHGYDTRWRGDNRPGFFNMENEWEDMEDGRTSRSSNQNLTNSYRPEISNPFTNTSMFRHRSSCGRRSSSGQRSSFTPIKRELSDNSMNMFHESRDYSRIPPPPFHFLACLYLDGREKPERKIIVYLDPNDSDYNKPNGKVQFKTRWVEGKDGNLREHAWLFRDVGIETVFDKMLISGELNTSDTVFKRDEDDIIAAMDSTELGAEGDDCRERHSKAGQIVVTIQRVKLGEKWNDADFHAKHKEGESDDVDMDGASKEITHTAGFGQAKQLKSQPIRVVAYTPFNEKEGVYATFQFFYRSEEKLRRFGFKNFPPPREPLGPVSNRLRSRRLWNSTLANMTPLAISNPVSQTPKSSRRKVNHDTFEDKIKKGDSFDEKDDHVEFGVHYRKAFAKREKTIKKEGSTSPDSRTYRLAKVPPHPNFYHSSEGPSSGSDTSSSNSSSKPNIPGLTLSLFKYSPSEQYVLRDDGQSKSISAITSPQNTLSRTVDPSSNIPDLDFINPDSLSSENGIQPILPLPSSAPSAGTSIPLLTSSSQIPVTESNALFKIDTEGEWHRSQPESDADDEHSNSDDSDKETVRGRGTRESPPSLFSDLSDEGIDVDDGISKDTTDDLSLHFSLGKIQLGKRGRANADEDNHYGELEEEKDIEISGGSSPPALQNKKGELMLGIPLVDPRVREAEAAQRAENDGTKKENRKPTSLWRFRVEEHDWQDSPSFKRRKAVDHGRPDGH
ncbi:MAG: hypothetical protein M1827_004779 [Pycnora praestabilis]|nr:MAG: hypothetical protein M1827_004779 [Pycnora praestabilis]